MIPNPDTKAVFPRHPAGLEVLLERWRSLTEEEHETIEQARWDALEALHETKKQLFQEMDRIPGIPRPVVEPVAGLIRDLQRREKANIALLGERLRNLREEMENLGHSSNVLRSVRSAYRPVGQTLWQSYS